MMTFIIMIAVGVGVATLIGGIAVLVRSETEGNVAEDRLSTLTGQKVKDKGKSDRPALLNTPLDDTRTIADELLAKLGNISHLMEQADVRMSGSKFLTICVISAAVGASFCLFSPAPKILMPFFAGATGVLPIFWLFIRRRNRIKKFNKQLPEALELLSRSLRSGHSLGSGFGLIATEMQEPISREFGQAFEEQNLGIPLEEALDAMTIRVPNMDLRFFATAVVLQRQTGGDLAEILDKIGRLIRERFKLAGTIQALTGEGRLSGIVLLALPPALFCVMYKLNYDYCMVLFRDPTGRQLLAGALVMQFVGALVIRKIITIKV
ncbi:MAG: type II secretion system F family protein [Aureliella sp.]|jgi:tight adherence protein B